MSQREWWSRAARSSGKSVKSTAGWWKSIRTTPSSGPRKHTALGRFRHENITLHCKPGEHLVAYLGDAFHAGNLVGGTPVARPEDFEINPRNPCEVFITFTDGAPGGDG